MLAVISIRVTQHEWAEKQSINNELDIQAHC